MADAELAQPGTTTVHLAKQVCVGDHQDAASALEQAEEATTAAAAEFGAPALVSIDQRVLHRRSPRHAKPRINLHLYICRLLFMCPKMPIYRQQKN